MDNIESNKIVIQQGSVWFEHADKKNKKYIFESEDGIECSKCPLSFMCHICFATGGKVVDNKIISSNETCDRAIEHANVVLKYKELDLELEKKRITEEFNKKLDKVIEGLQLVSNHSLHNREILDLLIHQLNNQPE